MASPMDADKRMGDGRLIGNDVPSGSLGSPTTTGVVDCPGSLLGVSCWEKSALFREL